jgi:O-antigen/teichoic acid export membrane protein
MTTAPVTAPLPEIRDVSQPVVSISAPGGFLTASKLLVWGGKSACSLIDQGLTALTGFSVSFLLARWLPPETYGAYAIAFAAYLFICGFHNVIVLEPMSILGPARHSTRLTGYFRAQIAVHAVLVGILSAVVAVAGAVVWGVAPRSPLLGAIVGSALALPFLLFLWLTRRMCYVLQRPLASILGSGSCLSSTLLGLYALRHLDQLTPFSAFLLVGGGSLLGSCLVLRQVGGSNPRNPSSAAPLAWRATLLENWSYGRWLVGSTILYSICGQVQMFLAAAFLGLGAAGVFRAMMVPAAVMTQVVSAADLLILPGFSHDFGRGAVNRMRQKAVFVSWALLGLGLCFAAFLWLVSARAEHLLFGGKYAAYAWLMPILALIPAANGFTMGYSTALRASQRPHFDLIANAAAAPVAVLSALGFIHWWGLAGAAASMVVGFVVAMAMNCRLFYATPQPVVAGLQTSQPKAATEPQP